MILVLVFFNFLLGLVFIGKASAEMRVESKAQIEDFIIYQAMKQGVSVELALGIAHCESNLNPLAKAKTSSASGIFQFIRGTWNSTTSSLLWEKGQDVFDPRLNIIAGIHLLKKDGPKHWECYNLDMI